MPNLQTKRNLDHKHKVDTMQEASELYSVENTGRRISAEPWNTPADYNPFKRMGPIRKSKSGEKWNN